VGSDRCSWSVTWCKTIQRRSHGRTTGARCESTTPATYPVRRIRSRVRCVCGSRSEAPRFLDRLAPPQCPHLWLRRSWRAPALRRRPSPLEIGPQCRPLPRHNTTLCSSNGRSWRSLPWTFHGLQYTRRTTSTPYVCREGASRSIACDSNFSITLTRPARSPSTFVLSFLESGSCLGATGNTPEPSNSLDNAG
jgi:hypothetical protein